MYSPSESARDFFLTEVVAKYNQICSFLRGYDRPVREYVSFLLINLISGMNDLDQIQRILDYLEKHQYEVLTALAKQDTSALTHHETRLKLTLAKPTIDYMLDNFERMAVPTQEELLIAFTEQGISG